MHLSISWSAQRAAGELHVVLNGFEELEQLVPTN